MFDRKARAVSALLAAAVVGLGSGAGLAAGSRSHGSADKPLDITQTAAATTAGSKAAASKTIDSKTAASKAADGKAADGKAAGGTTPTSLGQFGDWQAFQVGGGKTRSCFAISSPNDRQPAGLNRDPATLFITHRPSEGVRNEISVIAGFALKDGGDATLKIGSASYALYTKDTNAWVKDAAEQGTILGVMKKSRSVSFVGVSKRGRTTTDSYSLSGFSPAMDAISKACS